MHQVETTSNRQYPVSNQGRRAPEVKPHAIPCHPICLSSGPSEPAPLTGYLVTFILHDVCHFINSTGANSMTPRVRVGPFPAEGNVVLGHFGHGHVDRAGAQVLGPGTGLYRRRTFHETCLRLSPLDAELDL
jgi:hypothetical protein